LIQFPDSLIKNLLLEKHNAMLTGLAKMARGLL